MYKFWGQCNKEGKNKWLQGCFSQHDNGKMSM